jgi:hypothetical protein
VVDRYSPPQAHVEDLAPPDLFGPPAKPIAAWLFQFVAWIAIVGLCIGCYRSGVRLAHVPLTWTNSPLLIAPLVVRVVGIAWLVWTLALIHRMSRLARWLGAAALSALAVLVVLAYSRPPVDTDAYSFGWNAVHVLFIVLIFFWIHAFAFSAKARRYFAGGMSRSNTTHRYPVNPP